MAAEIHFNSKGEGCFTIVNKPAWHEIGTVQFPKDKFMTSEEAIKGSHLDYKVSKAKLFGEVDGNHIKIPKYYMYNEDTKDIFFNGSPVTDQYTIVQNVDAFSFFDSIVGEGKAIYETAGALKKGEIIFIVAKLPNYIRIAGKEEEQIDNYLVLTSRHDGCGAIKAIQTPIQVVCNNTLNAAFNGRSDYFTFNHSKDVHEKLKQAANLMHFVDIRTKELEHVYTNLSKIKIEDRDIIKLIAKTFLLEDEFVINENKVILTKDLSTRKQNIMDEVKDSIYYGVGQNLNTRANTLYGFISGVSYYFQNVKEYKSNGIANPQKKFINVMDGHENRLLNLATRNALDFQLAM